MTNQILNEDLRTIQAALRSFLEGELLLWRGLPAISAATLHDLWGEPSAREDTTLGWFPAQRITYPMELSSGGIAAYLRNNELVLIQGLVPPPAQILEGLGKPSAIKPREIVLPDAYVHEYLYCERGLVLSVAQTSKEGEALRIVRCRGIRPLEKPEQFDSKLYRSLENKILF
jgi:hypothetical protein